MENLIDDDLEKSLSNESDNDFNDETESDDEKDESNEQFVRRELLRLKKFFKNSNSVC